jgi:hypothetical protein
VPEEKLKLYDNIYIEVDDVKKTTSMTLTKKTDLQLQELKNKKIAEAQKVSEEIKKLQKEKDDLQKIIDDCENREKRLNAEKELLELIESSGSDSDNNHKKKSKKEIEKQRVKNANKERDRQKKEREAFYKRAGMI